MAVIHATHLALYKWHKPKENILTEPKGRKFIHQSYQLSSLPKTLHLLCWTIKKWSDLRRKTTNAPQIRQKHGAVTLGWC